MIKKYLNGFLKTKSILKFVIPVFAIFMLTNCESFFETNPDDIINDSDYVSTQSEIYSGYLGIINKMQEVGDQAIFLTDTRADFLEPTVNAPQELWDIYNYEDLSDNPFADPRGYYAVIIACNDYFHKMFEYKNKVGNAMDANMERNFDALISGALRIKVWTYLTLGKIYGKAIYFDDPLVELKDLSGGIFTDLNSLDAIVDKCLDLIDGGINGIDGNKVMNWGEWLDPEDPNNGSYADWALITPDYLCLRSELCLIKGIEYDWVRNEILSYLNEVFLADGYQFRNNQLLANNYMRLFAAGTYYDIENISSIIYDNSNNQTNRLITYFAREYPAEFLLKPTSFAMSKFDEDDNRGYGIYFMAQSGSDTVMTKYHYNYSWRRPYQSDVSIPLYRGHDLHFMLAEAENHLGNWDQAASILNEGVAGRFPTRVVDTSLPGWDSRYQSWIGTNTWYPNIGICGCGGASFYELPAPTDEGYVLTEEERVKIYDLALLDEMLKEYAAEGRAYGMMIRMAERYNDWSIVADRVVPKYPVSMQASISAKITSGAYYVDYNLD